MRGNWKFRWDGTTLTGRCRWRRRLSIGSGGLQSRHAAATAAEVRLLSVRFDNVRLSTQWGRGRSVEGVLYVDLRDGRRVDLARFVHDSDDEQWRHLCTALDELPFGRRPRDD